jgi:MoaA/NifB/PqqE/SkfB family radical SAM enzyme
MNIVALYKTFSGEDFVGLSLESIYSLCSKIVMIHSNYSWTGEKGNTVAPVVEKWKEDNDTESKIIGLYTDIKDQSAQYDLGLRYIRSKLVNYDYILLIDTDEVWDEKELNKLINYAKSDRRIPAFSVSLHTYIKSMFYRITPKEWCQPTVLVNNTVTKLDGIRGSSIKSKVYLEDVYMHHFTYVRFNEQAVMKKIYNTAATEGVRLVDMKDWVESKWNALPHATNFHTVDYARTSWKSVKIVELNDLPDVVKKHPEVYTRFCSNKNTSTSLRRCSRVGINVTWKCNWGCETCFYRFSKELHTNFDESIDVLKQQISRAKERGCDHVVMVGYGEPSLYSSLDDIISYISSKGMTSSMITNGATHLSVFEKMYTLGINHLHISSHAIGNKLDMIAHRADAGVRQAELKTFLKRNKLPWRTNTTIQSMNYKDLPFIIDDIIEHGAFHAVLLGFLPHYEWSDKSKADAVIIPPKELRPYIEKASNLLLEANRLFTIRYHPLCHLSPELWPYVTNARYVLYDPWEWEYGHHGETDEQFRKSALGIGAEVSIKSEPCNSCRLLLHCGGWNNTYARLCNGAELKAVTDIPEKYKNVIDTFGGLHILNPANTKSGHYSEGEYYV